ncbi:MAG: phosphonate C-P lyase system protein PhnG [Salinarimonas sp.]|nr:phosphonate C-P lyase system protein PhnG [Salinarimonas sp.]
MSNQGDPNQRRNWMGLLARSRPETLAALWRDFTCNRAGLEEAAITWLRKPETGTVMVRGRAGAVGEAFNLGEMTVTRASLRLPCGAVGHAYVQGRDREKARIAALVDALMAGPHADHARKAILAPLATIETEARTARASRAAATQVDFFTMVRGE